MAEEKPQHNPMHDVYFFITIVVIIVILWFAAGGPGKADLRGVFLNAPAPLGNGAAYGPGGRATQADTTTQPQFDTGSVAPPPPIQY